MSQEPLRPRLTFAPELLLRAQGAGAGMRAAIFDVDGVLTDGRIYIGEHGETVKAFSTLDGHGLKLLRLAGIEPVVITGRDSPAVRRRMADLGLVHAAFGAQDKLAAAQAVLRTLALDWPEVAAIGDDWPDLPWPTTSRPPPAATVPRASSATCCSWRPGATRRCWPSSPGRWMRAEARRARP
jgi:3-deoxy-D-manno-octulosonate 8-phosphate phosphatase (KDO 8-P phosphatase)